MTDTTPKRLRELAGYYHDFKYSKELYEVLLALAAEKEAQEPGCWVRQRPDGTLTDEYLAPAHIEQVRKSSGAWLPLYLAPQPVAEKEVHAELSMSMFASKEDYKKAVEAQQRERMTARSANRAPSPPTADFDLPHESDNVEAQPSTADVPLPEPAAHMYPSDLERFQENETFAQAYSVSVGCPDERSVPLVTLSNVVEYAQACAKAARDAAFEECAKDIASQIDPENFRDREQFELGMSHALEIIQAAKKGTT